MCSITFLEEKKVKRYLEDNFKHRQDLVKPDENLSNSNKEHLSEDDRPNHHSGIGPRTKQGNHGVLFMFLA